MNTPPNEQWAVKLSNVEGQLAAMAENVNRILHGMEKVIALDRTTAEHAVKLSNLSDKTRELEHDIKNCTNNHKLADEVLHRRIDELSREKVGKLEADFRAQVKEYDAYVNRTKGTIRALVGFSVLASSLIAGGVTWFYNRAETNRETNIVQTNDLKNQAREIDEIKRFIGK